MTMPSVLAGNLAIKSAICKRSALRFGALFGPGLQAVVLTGSMARGEATVVSASGVEKVLGDAEFLLIFPDAARNLPSAAELGSVCRAISQELRVEGIDCVVDAGRMQPRLLANIAPSIFASELKASGEVILGDPNVLSLLPAFRPSEIPCEDGWRLLMNRLVEMLRPAAELGSAAGPLPAQLRYRTAKLCLDTATSLLALNGAFESGYRNRSRRLGEIARAVRSFRGLPSEPEAHWPIALDRFSDLVSEATEYKLSGVPAESMSQWQYFAECLGYARSVWRAGLMRLTHSPESASDAVLLENWARTQPVRQRLRAWARLWRKPDFRRHALTCPGRVLEYPKASPRYGVYAAAAALAFQLPELLAGAGPVDEDWRAAGHHLPLVDRSGSGPASWRQLALAVTDNYERLLAGTHA